MLEIGKVRVMVEIRRVFTLWEIFLMYQEPLHDLVIINYLVSVFYSFFLLVLGSVSDCAGKCISNGSE